ncbi:MAG: hypothetical protein KDK70_24150 [Myxococcales bacterium]|nr:hypothetical protein [Myxococcales bacterium]
MTTKTALLATLVLALAGCEKGGDSSNPPADGGDVSDTSTEAGDGGSDASGGEAKTAPGAPDVKWADKSFQQRKEWMGIEVLPKMKAAFKEYDEAQFSKFGCDTCHGADGKDKNYAMPTDSIYPLPKDDPVKAAMEYDEKVTKFMIDVVVPQTAAMLDMEPYNPETGTGFGCMSCHPAE